MKLRVRILAFGIGALFILFVVLLARGYFLSLTEELKGSIETPQIALPLPILLLFGAAVVVSFALAAFLTLRALSRLRRKEREDAEKNAEAESQCFNSWREI